MVSIGSLGSVLSRRRIFFFTQGGMKFELERTCNFVTNKIYGLGYRYRLRCEDILNKSIKKYKGRSDNEGLSKIKEVV